MTMTENEMLDSAAAHMVGNTPVLLAYSCGKDATATWLLVEQLGLPFEAYYLTQVPGGLPSEHRYLDYAERALGKKIHRFTHPHAWESLAHPIFALPDAEWMQASYPSYTIEDLEYWLAGELGWTQWQVAVGNRKADSYNRKLLIERFEKTGWMNSRGVVYPVADLKYDEIEFLLAKARIKLPPTYLRVERSSDDLVTAWLSGDAADRAVLKSFFPAIEAVSLRHAL